jgi:hypothetical protein
MNSAAPQTPTCSSCGGMLEEDGICLVCLLNAGLEAEHEPAATARPTAARASSLPCEFAGYRLVREIASGGMLVATLEPSTTVPSGTTGAQLIFTLPETSDAVLTPGQGYWLAVGVDGINYDAGPGQQLGLLDWSYASTNTTTSDGWTVDNWIAVSNTNGAEWAASPGLHYVFDMTTSSVPEPSRISLLLTGFMTIILSRRRVSSCKPLGLALAALPLLFASCGKQSAPSPDHVLATVGDEIITSADFQQAAARRGGGHPESVNRRALLEELITESALVQKAHAQGLDQTPEFRRRSRTLLIALLRENVPAATSPPVATPDELTAIYHELKPTLAVPAAKRLAILQLTADSPGSL